MKRGDIFRTQEKVIERGNKPGYYLVVSRDFIVDNKDISTVICAPVYSEILGIRSEITVGLQEGIPRESAVRCDFLALIFKHKLARYVGSLTAQKLRQLDEALKYALDIRA